MPISRALRHPLAVGLLAGSLLLAFAPLLGASWHDRTVWFVVWGAIAYVAVVAVLAGQRPAVRKVRTPGPNDSGSDAQSDLTHLTEEALRYLRTPATLATCGLVQQLPLSLTRAHVSSGSASSQPTPLETARLLRGLIEESMDGLKLTAGKEPAVLQYSILHAEYIQGIPNSLIMSRHNVSESTFHRSRRAGVRAIANDLAAREARLAADSA